MKFTFKTETFGFGSPRTTYEFECDQIDDVFYHFKTFLRGAGYEIGMNDQIELVDKSWEYNNEPTFDDCYYQPEVDLDFDVNDEDIYITIPEEEPKKKKGKK